jgi:acyl-CoA synthetase (AMP-forming)/AMP-acid ligase II
MFHDMGLIGNVIQALYLGRPSILMSPIAFIQKPSRWLEAISRYRATTSGAPNFAYDLLCRHVSDDTRRKLDLSCWEVAFSGAEPIRVETIERFSRLFAPSGFRPEAFFPCYGMAEAVLFITGGEKTKPPTILYASEDALKDNRVVTSDREKEGFRSLVGCGRAWLDGQIAIVDPRTLTRCPADGIGEIWVAGSGAGAGYWNDRPRTEETFEAYIAGTEEGPFLRTGDLGFLQEGELFVTGRLHDVMVFWGLNHYPQLLEETIESCHRSLRSNGTATFSAEIDGEDRLIVATEVERGYRDSIDVDEVAEIVRWQLFEKHLVDVYAVVFLKPGSLPRTSSGKIQRHACKKKFLEGDLAAIGRWQRSPEQATDMTSVLRYYFNPLVHLRRFRLILRSRIKQFVSGIKP